MYNGLSLSFCVKDIAKGKVRIEDVGKITAGIAAGTKEDWDELLATYKESYWYDFPEKAEEIVRKLRQAGKIEQPRLKGMPPPTSPTGTGWTRAESKFVSNRSQTKCQACPRIKTLLVWRFSFPKKFTRGE